MSGACKPHSPSRYPPPTGTSIKRPAKIISSSRWRASERLRGRCLEVRHRVWPWRPSKPRRSPAFESRIWRPANHIERRRYDGGQIRVSLMDKHYIDERVRAAPRRRPLPPAAAAAAGAATKIIRLMSTCATSSFFPQRQPTASPSVNFIPLRKARTRAAKEDEEPRKRRQGAGSGGVSRDEIR
jgi:hypothetical protein